MSGIKETNIGAKVSSKKPDWCHFYYPGQDAPRTPSCFRSSEEARAAGSTLTANIFKMQSPAVDEVRIQHFQGQDFISVRLRQNNTPQSWDTEAINFVVGFLQKGRAFGNRLTAHSPSHTSAFNKVSARELVRNNVPILSRDDADIVIDGFEGNTLRVRMGGGFCKTCPSQPFTKLKIENTLREAYPAELRGVEIAISVSDEKPQP